MDFVLIRIFQVDFELYLKGVENVFHASFSWDRVGKEKVSWTWSETSCAVRVKENPWKYFPTILICSTSEYMMSLIIINDQRFHWWTIEYLSKKTESFNIYRTF